MTKKIFKIIYLLVFPMLIINCKTIYAQNEVKIGKQIWTVRNLDVSTFSNGDTILEVKTYEGWSQAGRSKQPAWCYYNFDSTNNTKYGKLYNWYAVDDSRGLAPLGWHIPTSKAWTRLYKYLGGGYDAKAKLKSIQGWLNNGNGSNESGFTAIPAGYFCSLNFSNSLERFGAWWSATEYDSGSGQITYLCYFNNCEYVLQSNPYKGCGFSVRCVRD